MKSIFSQQPMFMIIVLTIILAPLYVIRWTYFGVLPTTLLELLIWTSMVLYLIWRVKWKDFSLPKVSIQSIPFILLIFASFISIIVASDHIAALGMVRAYIWEPMMFGYIVYDVVLKQDSAKITANALLSVTVLSAFWIAALGIMQALLGWFIVTDHQALRAHAVFNNGNALALYIGPMVVMIFGWLYVDRRKKISGMQSIGIIVIVLLAAHILTKSTGGLLALLAAVGLVVMAVTAKRITNKFGVDVLFQVVIVGSFLVSLCLLIIAPFLTKSSDNPWIRTGGTGEVRLCVWEGTGKLLRDNWLLGVGFSGFKEVYSNNYITCDAEPLEYPHNFWMTVWTELGLIGVVAFLTLFWKLSKKIIDQRMQIGFAGAFIYILLHGIVDVPYFKNDLAVIFWVLVAFLCITEKK